MLTPNGFPAPFHPACCSKVIIRMKKTWTKLTDADIAMYMQGVRGNFSNVLLKKYHYTPEQAENALSTIEHLAEND